MRQFEGETSAVMGSVEEIEGTPPMIGDLFQTQPYITLQKQESKAHTVRRVNLLWQQARSNEHLEGQRDDLPYITAKVGTVSAASRVENPGAGVHTCFQHINTVDKILVRPETIS